MKVAVAGTMGRGAGAWRGGMPRSYRRGEAGGYEESDVEANQEGT